MKTDECVSCSCAWLRSGRTDVQTDGWAGRQSGQFSRFPPKILPVSACIVKFDLEMSASPSECVLAVIVLSISAAPACLPLLPLVKPWQRGEG